MTQAPKKWNKHSTEKELEALFSHYYAPLCGYAEKILMRRESSEEIVQELFVKLWEDRKKRDIKQVKAYLYSSVYRKALHYIQHQKVKEKYELNEKMSNENYPTPEEGMMMAEMYAAYQQELEQMNNTTKDIFLLSRHDEQSYKAIAEKMNVSIKTVEAHISKALKAFRHRFQIINK